MLCPSCVMSVTGYLLVMNYVSFGSTLSQSLTHSLKTNLGLISGSVGRHPDCYAEE